MLQKLLGEKQTPNEKYTNRKRHLALLSKIAKSEKEEDGGAENNFCTKRR